MLLRRRLGRFSPGTLAVALAVLAIAGYPLAELVYQSVFGEGRLDLRPYADLFRGDAATALAHTLAVSVASAMIALVLGTALALLVQRSDLPCKSAFALVLLFPLLTPPFVQAVSWLEAYARGGLTFHWWGISVDWLRGPAGVGALLALQSYPLVYLLVSAQLASQRGVELEEAARTAGAGPWRVLLDVTLPLLRPAVTAAGLVALISAASDFGIPAALGIPAGYNVVTTLIYRRLSLVGGAAALADMIALAALLACVAIVALVIVARLTRSTAPAPTVARREGLSSGLRLGAARWPALAALAGFLIVTVVLPLLALFLQSVAAGFVPTLNPAAWTSDHFATALAQGGLQALANSLGLAAAAGAIVALGGAAIAVAGRRSGSAGRLIEGLSAIPFALPGSVVAVAAILAWQRWLYGTLAIILLAYVARFTILGARAAGASLASLPDELGQAARSAGAPAWRMALDIQRPLIQPGLLAGFALVFLLAVHELTISSLLYTPQTETIAVQVLNAQQAGDVPVTAALAVILMAVTLAVALPLVLSGRFRRLVGAELSA